MTATNKTLSLSIGYEFRDSSLLDLALTHRSKIHGSNNERLEFLGDAVLSLITADFLYKHNGNINEGDLSRLRAQYVCKDNLAKGAKCIDLGSFILGDKAMRASGSNNSISVLSDALEAVFGAVYIDGGFLAAQKTIFKVLGEPSFKLFELQKDFKTKLQEKVQAKSQKSPSYILLEKKGPAHAPKFLVGVKVDGSVIATGVGENKRVAAQAAAASALSTLKAG